MKYIKKFEKFSSFFLNDQLLDEVRFGNLGAVIDLINNGADVNYKEQSSSWSPLITAALYNRLEIAKKLLESGADINITQDKGETPLMIACEINLFDMIQLFIKEGADWNIKNIDNNDFLDLISDEYKEYIIEDYPDKYKNYLMKKEGEKYNL